MPVTALSVPPEQLADLLAAVELVINIPVGKVSVTEKFVKLVSAGAVKRILSRTFVFGVTGDAENDLEAVTGIALFDTEVVALKLCKLLTVTPELLVAVTPPAEIVFV